MAQYTRYPVVGGGGGGSGTVTSVDMTVPSTLLAVSGNPVTTTGTLAITLPTRAANLVFAGPATGVDAAPAFRALVAADIPSGVYNAFTIMQPPNGTSPTASSATDTLTFASTDSSITITGNSGTKTLAFIINPNLTLTTLTASTVTANLVGNASTVTTNANLTGPITSVGNATAIASKTGTGSTFVMSAAPTITGVLTLSSYGTGTLVSDASGVITSQNIIARGSAVSELFDDFLGDISGSSTGSAGNMGWTPSKGAGVGTLVSQIAANASAANPGIISMNAGTTGAANANASIRLGLASFILGGGALTWEALWRLPVLSTATEQFDVHVGLASTSAGAEPTNGVYVAYTPTATIRFSTTTNGTTTVTIGAVVGTDAIDNTSIQPGMAVTGTNIAANSTVVSVNYAGGTMVLNNAATGSGTQNATFTVGDYIIVRAASASAKTTQVTSVKPVAGTFIKVGATTNAAGTSTVFTVSGTTWTVAATHPTIAIFPVFEILKNTSAGAATSVLDADYWGHRLPLTVAR